MRRTKGEGSAYLRGKIWWVKYSRNGKSVCESSKSTKEAEAWRLLRKRLAEIEAGRFIGPKADKMTIEELANDVLRDYEIEEQDSLDKAQRSAKRIKDRFGSYKAHVLADSPAHIDEYIEQRQREGAENATINRELSFLKRAFNLGIQNNKIQRKPYIRKLKENAARKGFFEYPEFVAVRDASPDWFKPVVTFAYYTAWRKEEILNLRWSQVDLEAQEIRLYEDETKGDAARIIALEDELLETMREQWERRKVAEIPGQAPALLCPYVFHRNGKKIGGKHGDIRDVWHNACVAAGLGRWVEIDCNGKTKKQYSGKIFHDFRRTAVRDMVRAGIPERVAMAISGHKTRSVFERYNIVSTDDLRQAAKRRFAHVQELERKVVSIKRR